MPDKTGNNRDKRGRFVSGKTGNPKGRPKGTTNSLKDAMRRIGDESTPTELAIKVRKLYNLPKTKKLTMDECIIRLVYVHAVQGKQWAINFLAEHKIEPVPDDIKNKATEIIKRFE